MGTRSGDLDPAMLELLHHKEGMSFDELDTLLNKRSGLLGISGLTNDMRELLAEETRDRRPAGAPGDRHLLPAGQEVHRRLPGRV